MQLLKQCLAIALAGSLGALARFFVASACRYVFTDSFVGTMIINLSGSLFLGWFMGVAGDRIASETLRLAIAVGFVGAYTTFSTFMFETNALVEGGQFYKAVANLIFSIALGLIAVRVGAICAQRF
ncbi:MAG TPA: fluoride efflux transporter CrcB [Tepidisphaeraceae bacterium]